MQTPDEGREKVSTLAGGWDRTVRDFGLAVHLARLTASQLLLVHEARFLSWTQAQIDGREEAYPFRLNISEIARLGRYDRTTLQKKLADLVTRQIFLGLGDGSMIINKDYRTWVDPEGGSLLFADQVSECQKRRRRVKTVAEKPQVNCGKKATGRICRPVAKKPQLAGEKATGRYDRPVAKKPQFPAGPIEERADAPTAAHAELNTESLREEILIPSLSPKSGPLAERDSGDGTGELPTKDNPADEAVAWTLERVAIAYPGDESILEVLPMWVKSWVDDGHELIVIKDATIKALSVVRQASGLVSYVKRCLDSAKLAPRSGTGPAAPPAPSKHQALADDFEAWARSRKEAL